MAAAARCKVHVPWTAILRLDSEHVCVGIVATVGELIGEDRYQLFDTRKDCVSSFNILPQKNYGGLHSVRKNAEDKPAHPRSAPKQCHSTTQFCMVTYGHNLPSNLGRIDLVNPKTRHELMDE